MKPADHLSPHFRLREFHETQTGAMPPTRVIPGLQALCAEVLEPLRARFGRCTVISGYRTRAHNVAVAGAPHSYHLYEEVRRPAADVWFARGTPAEWGREAEHLLQHGGLGVYAGHIHVDLRGFKARWTG